jgi:hypothetical protein
MPLPQQLLDFISQKIELENYFLPHFYPTPESFDAFQIGYRVDGNTGEKITGTNPGDFKESWYVICSSYADDPFFVDFTESAQHYPVYFAQHGTGKWTPLLVAESISAFATALRTLQTIEEHHANRQDAVAQHFNLDEEFWREVYNEYEEFPE